MTMIVLKGDRRSSVHQSFQIGVRSTCNACMDHELCADCVAEGMPIHVGDCAGRNMMECVAQCESSMDAQQYVHHGILVWKHLV